MQLPDVDVLIYAHREDSPEHERYADWLRDLATKPEPCALSSVTLAGFLRITTNPRIFADPTPPEAALVLPADLGERYCAALVALPPLSREQLEHDLLLQHAVTATRLPPAPRGDRGSADGRQNGHREARATPGRTCRFVRPRLSVRSHDPHPMPQIRTPCRKSAPHAANPHLALVVGRLFL